MANNLFNAIRIAHRSPTAILNLLVESYSKDYTTFATGNNRAPLEEAVKILTGSKLDRALALAISRGYQAGGLTVGYIGAVTGKYSAQPSETHARFDGAIERATSAFRVTLTDSGLFAEKEEKSKSQKEEEKVKREEEKVKREAETKAAILNAAVVAGEVVRASDVNPVTAYSDFALADLIGDRINAGIFLESAAESVAIDIGNKYPKAVTRVVNRMINLKHLDTATMALLLESIHVNMNAESFKNVLSYMGFETTAKKTTAKKTAAKKTAAKKTTADTVAADTVAADTVAADTVAA